MSIRKSFEAILNKYGHNAIYVRRNLCFHCSCYSERSGGSSVSSCPKCLGTGYAVSFERIKVRRQIASVPESLVRARKNYEVGNISPKAYLYYLKHSVKPKEGDIIIEVDWENGIPTSINEKNVIGVSDPKHGEGGRIEFYEVYVRYETKGEEDKDALTKY